MEKRFWSADAIAGVVTVKIWDGQETTVSLLIVLKERKGEVFMTERFDNKLIELLKTNPDFVDDTGELLRDRIKHFAWQFDHDLINLLLTDKEVEAKFFEEINGRWFFNNNTFVDYINDKHFLDNSYTRFSNKIGLNIDNNFLRERGEVVLALALQGLRAGRGSEATKKKNVPMRFSSMNFSLQDEINRLLDPKALD